MKHLKILVTGAGGQIGYSLLFRLASGEVFGKDTKVSLNLLEVPQGLQSAKGVALELWDCGFNTLENIDCFDDPLKAFDGIHWALLVGSKPRGPGMERADLLKENAKIFVSQGKALLKADKNVRAIVVGNPCNTNALILAKTARDVPKNQIMAMTMLDENRAKHQLSNKANLGVELVKNLAIWGNHSPTMYADFENARINEKKTEQIITDRTWLEEAFLSKVQKRGAEIIEVRGKSSAASAASACIDHIKRLGEKTPDGTCFSAAVYSKGNPYGIDEDLMFSFPLTSDGENNCSMVKNVSLSEFAKKKLKITEDELLKERDIIKDLL